MKQISELYNFSRNIFSPYEAWDQSWNYGRLHALPLWPEFVCISRYGKNTKYTHYCPTVNAIEFPLEGNLNIALTGENITLSPANFLFSRLGNKTLLRQAIQISAGKFPADSAVLLPFHSCIS